MVLLPLKFCCGLELIKAFSGKMASGAAQLVATQVISGSHFHCPEGSQIASVALLPMVS